MEKLIEQFDNDHRRIVCPECDGTKTIADFVGLQSVLAKCPKCDGKGYIDQWQKTYGDKSLNPI